MYPIVVRGKQRAEVVLGDHGGKVGVAGAGVVAGCRIRAAKERHGRVCVQAVSNYDTAAAVWNRVNCRGSDCDGWGRPARRA